MSENPDPELREQPEPEMNERPEPEFVKKSFVLPNKRRDPAFYIALALATFCILGAFSVTAFFAGFITGSTTGRGGYTSAIAVGDQPMMKQQIIMGQGGSWTKLPPRQIMAKVAIFQGSNGPQFSQPAVKLPSGSGIVLINQTNQTQILIANNGSRRTVLTPNQFSTLFIKGSRTLTLFMEGSRTLTLQLESDPSITLTIYVVGQ